MTTEGPRPGTAAPDGPVRSSITWGDPRPAVAQAPVGAGGRRARTATVLIAAALAVAAVAAGALLVPWHPADPQEPDRYAVEQVAKRYRALGAGLLSGALRCAPLAPTPGDQEVAQCTFGAWSVALTAYDTTDRLLDARRRASTPATDSVRAAARTEGGAAFAMDETAGGTVTVYWDTTAPRPVSASVSTTDLSLPDLLGFYDDRGFAALTRPEPPGAGFAHGRLWAFAAPFVEGRGTTCGPIPVKKKFDDATEGVRCSYPNGVGVDFALLPGPELAQYYRGIFLAEDHLTTPGTLRLGTWQPEGGPEGRTAEYVATNDHLPYLYFDRPDTFCFGLMFQKGFTQDQLKAFWAGT
jgi:hypothetical protein